MDGMQKNIMRWPTLLAVIGIFLLVIGATTMRESYRSYQVDQEMDRLQQQIHAMEGKRAQLADVIRRLQSPDVLEKEARTRFGLRKQGERVFVLEGNGWQDPSRERHDRTEALRDRRSNPEKWLAYFFLHQE